VIFGLTLVGKSGMKGHINGIMWGRAAMTPPITARAFYGHYRHSADEKGRVSIPAEFRPLLLGDRGSFFINRGVEQCIAVYPEEKWARVLAESNISALDNTNTRWFKRGFFYDAKEISCDQQGRILLPQDLMEYAGIKKDVIVIGMSDYVEIWDAAVWEECSKKAMAEFAGRMEEMSRLESTRKHPDQTAGGA